MGPGDGRPPAAPRDPALHRGPARRLRPARRARARRHGDGRPRARGRGARGRPVGPRPEEGAQAGRGRRRERAGGRAGRGPAPPRRARPAALRRRRRGVAPRVAAASPREGGPRAALSRSSPSGQGGPPGGWDTCRVAALPVVIVSYNSREWLTPCLTSIAQHAGEADVEVIVVDNDSTDGSADVVERDFPGARALPGRNGGFAYGNNRGFLATDAPYVLFLNADAEIAEGTLSGLLDELRARPDVGLRGCRPLAVDGRRFPRRLPPARRGRQRLPHDPPLPDVVAAAVRGAGLGAGARARAPARDAR